MAQQPLGPPPRVETGTVFDRWMNNLWNRISVTGQILWAQIDFALSNLTDIATRNHADLQNLNTASYTHLSATNHTDLTDGGDSTLHYHSSDKAPVGSMIPFAGISAPSGWLLCYGQSVSRSTYADLWAALSATKTTPTMTIATPCVVTSTGHGLAVGDAISFNTTGALPTGVTAGTTYYVAGTVAADTFNISATQGGANINTSGSQSGTHTLYHNPHGTGASTTNFLLPDMRGRTVVGGDKMGGSAASRMTSGGSGVYGANLGSVGGSQTHTLQTTEIPSHTHSTGYALSGSNTFGFVYTGETYNTTNVSGSTGGGGAHNNTQPTLVVNYIIKT